MKNFVILFLLLSGVIFAQASWVEIGEMPRPVYGGRAVLVDTVIYIIGGYDEELPDNSSSKYSDSIRVYFPESKTWGQSVKMAVPRYGLIGANYNDSLIYLGGVKSNNSNTSEIYNGNTTPYIYFTNPDFDRDFGTGVVVNNYFYLFGGNNSLANFNYFAKVNIETGTTDIKSDLNFTTAVTDQSSASDSSDIYLFGGIQGILLSKNIYKYNISSNAFSLLNITLDKPRIISGAIHFANNKYYLIGGIDETKVVPDVEIFDAGNLQVTKGPALNKARKKLMAVKYKNSIYVFGGIDNDKQTVKEIERLDITTKIIGQPENIVRDYHLFNNYPNPFNPSTVLKYSVPEENFVTLKVYNVLGEEVTTLVNETKPAGVYEIKFNSKTNGILLHSGVYFYRMQAGNFIQTKKMILLK